MTAGDGIKSVLILRDETCLKMESKALPGHAMSKEWKQSKCTRQYEMTCRHRMCNSPRMGLCSHFGRSVKKMNATRAVIRKRMKGVWIYLHAS